MISSQTKSQLSFKRNHDLKSFYQQKLCSEVLLDFGHIDILQTKAEITIIGLKNNFRTLMQRDGFSYV